MDEFVLVSEEQIAAAMRRYHSAREDTIEGAAGVAVAALLQKSKSIAGLKVAVLVCGGNISEQTLHAVNSQ